MPEHNRSTPEHRHRPPEIWVPPPSSAVGHRRSDADRPPTT
ncbi:hypothetical protein A2U01_0115661, partial [Trifolium medium]|nr:hypothetical protein [Trifolium medium]